MALTLTNDILKFRESTSDPWERLLIQANMNFNLIYPVGSIYMSTVNVDPGTIFGGTWERLKDKFLLGAGDTYTAGDIGGEAEHTLTVDEIPAHTHGSKSLVGTMNPLSWASSASESGIVSGVQQHIDRVGNSGSNWGDRLYTINATHEHDSIGGSQAHNNMPPYLVVYMWRRLTLSPTIYTPPANVLIGEVASEDIVPIAKGGTGATTVDGAITNLGFVNGSDSNGYYTKLPDGTLVQWGTVDITSGTTSSCSPVYILNVTITFPVSFYDATYVITGSAKYGTGAEFAFGQGTTYESHAIVRLWDTTSRTASSSTIWRVKWQAIGRWKA